MESFLGLRIFWLFSSESTDYVILIFLVPKCIIGISMCNCLCKPHIGSWTCRRIACQMAIIETIPYASQDNNSKMISHTRGMGKIKSTLKDIKYTGTVISI